MIFKILACTAQKIRCKKDDRPTIEQTNEHIGKLKAKNPFHIFQVRAMCVLNNDFGLKAR